MPSYEVLCIATARATAEHLCNLVKKVHQTLSRRGGVIRRVENFGNRPLAYPIKAHAHKHHIGRYFNLVIHASPQSLKEVQHRLHTDEGIIRFLATKSPLKEVLGHPALAVDTAPALSAAHYDALKRTTNIDYYIARTLLETGKITPEEIKALGTYTPAISPSLRLLEEREATATGIKVIQEGFARDYENAYRDGTAVPNESTDQMTRLKSLWQFAKDLTTLKSQNQPISSELLKSLSEKYQVDVPNANPTVDEVLKRINQLRTEIYGAMDTAADDPEGVLAVYSESGVQTQFRPASGDMPSDAELRAFFEPNVEQTLKGQTAYDSELGMNVVSATKGEGVSPAALQEVVQKREKFVMENATSKSARNLQDYAFSSPQAYELKQREHKLEDELEYAVDDAIEEYLYDNPKIRAMLPKGDYDIIMQRARAYDGLNVKLTYPQQFMRDIVTKKLTIEQAFEKYLAQVQTHTPNEIVHDAIQQSIRTMHTKGAPGISSLMRTPQNAITLEMAWEATKAQFGDVALNFYAAEAGKDLKDITAAEQSQARKRAELEAVRTLMIISPPAKSFFAKSAEGTETFDQGAFEAWFQTAKTKAEASVNRTLKARLVQAARAKGVSAAKAESLAQQVMEALPLGTQTIASKSSTPLRSDLDKDIPAHMPQFNAALLSDAPGYGLEGRVLGRVADPVTFPVAALSQERGELIHRVLQTERQTDVLDHPLAQLATKSREPVARALREDAKAKTQSGAVAQEKPVEDLVQLMGYQHDLLMDLITTK